MALMTKIIIPISTGHDIYLHLSLLTARSMTGGYTFDVYLLLEFQSDFRLIDLAFKFIMSWCLRIVPDLFLRDMYETLSTPRSQMPPKTAHYSPMLHNSILAVATAFSDDPRIRDLKARQTFATLAKSYVETECQQPNISVVHALSCLGSYHSGLGEQTLGYLYFGMEQSVRPVVWISLTFASRNERQDEPGS